MTQTHTCREKEKSTYTFAWPVVKAFSFPVNPRNKRLALRSSRASLLYRLHTSIYRLHTSINRILWHRFQFSFSNICTSIVGYHGSMSLRTSYHTLKSTATWYVLVYVSYPSCCGSSCPLFFEVLMTIALLLFHIDWSPKSSPSSQNRLQ